MRAHTHTHRATHLVRQRLILQASLERLRQSPKTTITPNVFLIANAALLPAQSIARGEGRA